MTIAPFLLGAIAALLQASVLPAFYLDPWAAPLLPSALVAAWAVIRRPEETWAIVLAGALILGVVSTERTGWFLLALLPSVGIAMLLATVAPRHHSFVAGLGRAAATAAAGTGCYLSILAIVSGNGAALAPAAPQVIAAGLATAALAGVGVIALRPLRPRPRGLYA